MNGWRNQFGIKDISAPLSIQHEKEIISRRQTLVEIISFCKERSLKPYIVIPVMHKALSSQFTAAFKHNYMDSLMANVDADVLDFMEDEIGLCDKYFATALCLNKEGAQIFTQKVMKRIYSLENQ